MLGINTSTVQLILLTFRTTEEQSPGSLNASTDHNQTFSACDHEFDLASSQSHWAKETKH